MTTDEQIAELASLRRWLGQVSIREQKLRERVNGEAEARSHLSGQFHEAITQLVDFAVEAHTAIGIAEANVFALTKQQERLIDFVEKHVQHTGERDDALSTALKAVYEVTKPRPSRTQRLWRRLRGEGLPPGDKALLGAYGPYT